MVKVRYAGRPWEEIEVSEIEARDLDRMGLLAPEPTAERVKSGEPTPSPKPNK